jgi:hypothetical protein
MLNNNFSSYRSFYDENNCYQYNNQSFYPPHQSPSSHHYQQYTQNSAQNGYNGSFSNHGDEISPTSLMTENVYSTATNEYDLITNSLHKMSPSSSYIVGDMTIPPCFRFNNNENGNSSFNSNNHNNNNNYYSFQNSSTPHYYNSHYHNNPSQSNYGNITIHNTNCISTHLHQA